jgi:hypothetical protein
MKFEILNLAKVNDSARYADCYRQDASQTQHYRGLAPQNRPALLKAAWRLEARGFPNDFGRILWAD